MMVAIMSPNKAAMAAPTMTLVIPDIPHSPGPQQKAISLETVTMKWFNELFDHPTMTVATFFFYFGFYTFLATKLHLCHLAIQIINRLPYIPNDV